MAASVLENGDMPRLVTEIDQVLVQNHAVIKFPFYICRPVKHVPAVSDQRRLPISKAGCRLDCRYCLFFVALRAEVFLAGACRPRDFLWVESVAIIDPLCKTVILGFCHSSEALPDFQPAENWFHPNNIFLSPTP